MPDCAACRLPLRLPAVACARCDQLLHATCVAAAAAATSPVPWTCDACRAGRSVPLRDLLATAARDGVFAARMYRDLARRWHSVDAIEPPPRRRIGAIPAIPVGTCWASRRQVSEALVHRPPQAGIAGSGATPAPSICLSGGYDDDYDLGNSFLYTGSGGRDANGTPVAHQTLTRANLALAHACASPLGCRPQDDAWRRGSPIRVVRSAQARPYGPPHGYRYDGLYKVHSYWREPSTRGLVVWRFLLQRDDPEPAPWTPPGRARAVRLHLARRAALADDASALPS